MAEIINILRRKKIPMVTCFFWMNRIICSDVWNPKTPRSFHSNCKSQAADLLTLITQHMKESGNPFWHPRVLQWPTGNNPVSEDTVSLGLDPLSAASSELPSQIFVAASLGLLVWRRQLPAAPPPTKLTNWSRDCVCTHRAFTSFDHLSF